METPGKLNIGKPCEIMETWEAFETLKALEALGNHAKSGKPLETLANHKIILQGLSD